MQPRAKNWLGLVEGAGELIVRCYFEEPTPTAADTNRIVPLTIDPVEPVGPPAPWDDASVAAGLRRVSSFVRSRTLDQPKPGERVQPTWVSTTPNVFPPPELPGTFAFAAADAAYSMAPYLLAPDEALVHHRPLARVPVRERRAVDAVPADVRLRAPHREPQPGVDDARARRVVPHGARARAIRACRTGSTPKAKGFGMMFWRFFIPEGEVETPQATVVKFADVKVAGRR